MALEMCSFLICGMDGYLMVEWINCSRSGGSMHYERAPHFKRLKLGMRRRLRCAALCRASLRLRRLESNGRWQRVQEGIGKTAGQWHFTLRERFRGRE